MTISCIFEFCTLIRNAVILLWRCLMLNLKTVLLALGIMFLSQSADCLTYGLAKVDINLPEFVSQTDRDLVANVSFINFIFVDDHGELQTAGFKPQGQYLRGEKYLITGKYTVLANFWAANGKRIFSGRQEIEITSDKITELKPEIEKDFHSQN